MVGGLLSVLLSVGWSGVSRYFRLRRRLLKYHRGVILLSQKQVHRQLDGSAGSSGFDGLCNPPFSTTRRVGNPQGSLWMAGCDLALLIVDRDGERVHPQQRVHLAGPDHAHGWQHAPGWQLYLTTFLEKYEDKT